MRDRFSDLEDLDAVRNAVVKIDAWLDTDLGPQYQTQPLALDFARVTKSGEEVGEAIEALLGCTGGNPRKGDTHTVDDVLKECADVSLTGMYAIQHFTKDIDRTIQIITDRARTHLERVGLA